MVVIAIFIAMLSVVILNVVMVSVVAPKDELKWWPLSKTAVI